MTVRVTNSRNCNDCGKQNVCKFTKEVLWEVEELTQKVKDVPLPLHVNINCSEWISNTTYR